MLGSPFALGAAVLLLRGCTQMDLPALNGFEIIESLEAEFGLQSYPINWCVLACLTAWSGEAEATRSFPQDSLGSA